MLPTGRLAAQAGKGGDAGAEPRGRASPGGGAGSEAAKPGARPEDLAKLDDETRKSIMMAVAKGDLTMDEAMQHVQTYLDAGK